jgi:hypothetical protein
MYFISPEKEYPRFIVDLQQDYPEWDIGDELPSGWIQVKDVTPPEQEDEFSLMEEGYPLEIEGEFVRNLYYRPMTEQEKEFATAPETLKAKLEALGLTSAEINILRGGI